MLADLPGTYRELVNDTSNAGDLVPNKWGKDHGYRNNQTNALSTQAFTPAI